MNFLPIELENEINKYKYEAEHFDKFKNVLNEFKDKIHYKTENDYTIRYNGNPYDFKNHIKTIYIRKNLNSLILVVDEENIEFKDIKIKGIDIYVHGN